MTDGEFNRYCAEVMGYDEYLNGCGYAVIDYKTVDYNPAANLNQMAEVFDKLWESNYLSISCADWCLDTHDGIAQAMREFIESTKGESE